MLDLVAFLEQWKDPRNMRRMETTAIYPGRYEWLEMMTQMRGPRSSEDLILHHVILGDLLQWKWFSKTWVCSATVIEMYHLPHSLSLKSFVNLFPVITFLHHSVT